jgi:hypothetical protein
MPPFLQNFATFRKKPLCIPTYYNFSELNIFIRGAHDFQVLFLFALGMLHAKKKKWQTSCQNMAFTWQTLFNPNFFSIYEIYSNNEALF